MKNQKINMVKLVQILFFTFPLSFIPGNLIVNLHLLLFIAASLFLIKKEQLKLRFKKFYWLLIFFFLYLFLSTAFQFYDFFHEWGLLRNIKIGSIPLEDNSIFKSFALIRFLIFIFIVDMDKIDEPLYSQKEVINHATIHFYQIIETGVIGFYLLFLLELLGKSIYYRSIKKGYSNISFEIEAYKNMKNLDYLKHRKKYNWIKYLTKKA